MIMNGIGNPIYSLEQAADQFLANSKSSQSTYNKEGLSFEDIFEEKTLENSNDAKVTFSKHAYDRLESRNINLTTEQVDRLNQGIKAAREKNINESLVMMDNLAFIVSVDNNTVITALDQKSKDSNIFTNIDGAVII